MIVVTCQLQRLLLVVFWSVTVKMKAACTSTSLLPIYGGVLVFPVINLPPNGESWKQTMWVHCPWPCKCGNSTRPRISHNSKGHPQAATAAIRSASISSERKTGVKIGWTWCTWKKGKWRDYPGWNQISKKTLRKGMEEKCFSDIQNSDTLLTEGGPQEDLRRYCKPAVFLA